MNLSLQDPFAVAKEYPETLTHKLQYGHSVVIQFNHKGDYLASGLSDGSVIIYDLTCNAGVITILQHQGHVRPICSISWSKCGRYLLTASQDWSCKLWDLNKVNRQEEEEFEDPPVIRSIKFDGPIWLATLHPENHFLFTASLFDDDPVLVDMSTKAIQIHKLSTIPLQLQHQDESTSADGAKELKSVKKSDKQMTLVTTFSPNNGAYIFAGTSKGWLNIISTETRRTVHSIHIANSNIKNLVISPNGRKLAINSSDRIIRQVSLPDLINISDPSEWDFEVEHKYQDVVNRLQWNSVAFNHNAEFLIASTFGQSSQDIYMWETSLGSLIKILEGSSEELIDVKWNSHRCTIGSTGLDSGTIYLWLIQFPQKWSALAPDFVEIEENIEYEEKEDEFDIIDEVALNRKRLEEEDAIVDITTTETVDARGFDTTMDSFIIPINYELPLTFIDKIT